MKKFNVCLSTSSPQAEATIQQLKPILGLVRKEQLNALKVILLNLYRYDDVIISRQKQGLGSNRYNPNKIGSKAVIRILDKLDDKKYIRQELGYIRVNEEGEIERKRTVISMTPLLKQLLTECGWYENQNGFYYKRGLISITTLNHEPIVLRKKAESKHKTLMDYEETAYTLTAREQMEKYNALLADTLILAEYHDDPEYFYVDDDEIARRYFIYTKNGDHFVQGGRLTGAWSNLGKEIRANLTLDDEETIEIDFQASSINTLYIHETGQSYQHGDPYHLELDGEVIAREVIKKIANVILFCKNINNASEAIKKHFLKDIGIQHQDIYLSCLNTHTVKELIEAFIEKHQVISEYFLQGKSTGLYIQFLESERVMSVVNELVDKEIPVLTVYDSFITPCTHEQELITVMNKYS